MNFDETYFLECTTFIYRVKLILVPLGRILNERPFNDAEIDVQTDLLSFYKEKCNLPVTCKSGEFQKIFKTR